ncbi:hypothetical protein OIU79_015731 [Salix purpurea]|uniref:Uncharacterized protein n=1 Tax=Salix purpurea TaxID=77065 RepID=A0A9Q0SQA3_SALPP|nr:hypothetical protein OIU79_015731 [Salix purpurea]
MKTLLKVGSKSYYLSEAENLSLSRRFSNICATSN